MKNFLFQGFQFTIYAFLFYVLGVFFWNFIYIPSLKKNITYHRGTYGHMYTRINDLNQTKDVDILFLGASTAYRGFDTQLFDSLGYKSFNLGSSAQTPIQTQLLLKQYLSQLNPKFIIYEVNPNVFLADGLESSIDMISNNKIDIETLKMVLKVNHIKAYNTFIVSFFYHFFDWHKDFHEEETIKEDTYIKGGFVKKELNFFTPTKANQNEKIDFKPKEYQIEAFKSSLDIIKKQGKEFVLVRAPNTSYRNAIFYNQGKIDSTMNSFGPYFNFNNLVELSDSLHFYDPAHLNQNGVVKFNLRLIDLLKEKGNL